MTYEEQQRALAAQALQAWGAPMVPTVGGTDPAADPLAAQNAALAAQAQQDAQMAMAGPPAPPPAPTYVDPSTVSSMPPEMSAAPPMSAQQQLAAQAYAAWSPNAAQADGLAGWQPPPEVAGPPSPPPARSRVISVDEQNVTAAPPPQAGGGGQRRAPSMLDEQTAIAGASRDEANQARVDADISTDMQAELTQMEGEQKSETAKLMAARALQQQEDLEEAGRLASEKRSIKEAVANDVSAQYKKLSDEAAAVEIKDRRSTGTKVMGAIAIALGGMQDQNNLTAGLMQGMNVQTHNAEQISGMISEAVDRDIAIQRDNLSNKQYAAGAKLTELGLARDAIKDVDAQEMAAKAALMDKYALGLDAIKAQGLGESATTSAALAAEKIRGDAALMRAQAMEQQATKDEDRLFGLQLQREKERKAAAGRGSPQMLADLMAKEAAGQLNVQEADTLNKLRKGAKDAAPEGGGAGSAPPRGRDIRDPALAAQVTKEERSKFNETQNVTQALEGKIDRLLQLRAEHGVAVGTPGTDAYKEAQTLNRGIMLGLKRKEELGTLDNQSERFLNEMTGDPNAWFINTPETALKTVKRGAREDLEGRARDMGYSSSFDAAEEYGAKYGAVAR